MSGVRFEGRDVLIFLAVITFALCAQASFAASCVQSSHANWNNTSIAAQTGTFTATFNATPSRNDMDGLAGFSLNRATGFTSLAAIVRFNDSGTIDVMNGADYAASRAIPYSAGSTYHIQMAVNPASHTYSVFVTPPGGSAVSIASNYLFRNEQATTSKLNNWAVFADIGSISACSLSVTPSGSSGTGSATAPTITSGPSSQTVAVGQSATFSVTATGTAPLAYQWKKNGSAVSGATSASYTTPATTTADNGSKFTVAVSNSAGSVTSAAATLTVTSSPAISWAPSSLSFGSVKVGTAKTLAVTISSTGASATTISSDAISGAGFSAVGVPPLSGLILSPGQTATLNVTFAPSAGGSASGSAIIASNASNSPTVTIPLSASGAQTTTHSVGLSWQASASSQVAGYNVYRASVSGGPYTKQNLSLVSTLSYTDTSVVAGDTYFYVVTAVNSANQQSADSNQVSAAIP